MPTLAVVNFNIVCAIVGGFITCFGLVSYLLKEKFYMSEALISTVFGIIVSPHATNFIRPLEYANGIPEDLETVTLYFSRLVLGVQLVLAGVQLPSKYLRTEWKSLSLLLGPGMCAMWMSTALLVWALVPDINFLFALAVGSCVTPTDPVLSNTIVKGKFADKNIPKPLQRIIIAESGANDGLGYPFLFLALYLVKYTGDHGLGVEGGAGKAMALWFYDTWVYVIILSVVYGAVVGWLAKEALHWAEERRYVDRESFLVFAIALALFIVGTVGMIGSDDVLACFIAGNVFTWDDWFRLETMDDSLQPTIDMLLNVSIFMWYGAVCPWHKFVSNDVIPIYRLIPLGILVLLFRRPPEIFGMHKYIHQIEDRRKALFVGFFGPIGVSAIFYLYISREFLRKIEVDGQEREDAIRLGEVTEVVVWFLVICSIVVHGLSIPLGKLGFYLPRTISTAISSERVSATTSQARPDGDSSSSFQLRQVGRNARAPVSEASQSLPNQYEDGGKSGFASTLSKFGKHVWRDIKHPPPESSNGQDHEDSTQEEEFGKVNGQSNDSGGVAGADLGGNPNISAPRDARLMSHAITGVPQSQQSSPERADEEPSNASSESTEAGAGLRIQPPNAIGSGWQRSVRFGDETPPDGNVRMPLDTEASRRKHLGGDNVATTKLA